MAWENTECFELFSAELENYIIIIKRSHSQTVTVLLLLSFPRYSRFSIAVSPE